VEVVYLLLYGDLPNRTQMTAFEVKLIDEMMVHQRLLDFYKGFTVHAHPMGIMCSIVGALSSFIHTLDIRDPI